MEFIPTKKALKILEEFFYLGLQQIQIGTLVKNTGYDFKTVKKYIKELLSVGLITKSHAFSFPTYMAAYRNSLFLLLKKNKMIGDIYLSSLPHYLEKKLGETACILFGSCARGDYYLDSDIDIYIQSKKVAMELSSFEKKLKRNINLFFEERWQDLSPGLQTGLVNDGVALSGRLKI